jgi:hypothetical protein
MFLSSPQMGDFAARLAAALQAAALVVADRSSGHWFQITVPWFMKVLMPRAGTWTSPAATALDGLDAVDESAAVDRLPNIILPCGHCCGLDRKLVGQEVVCPCKDILHSHVIHPAAAAHGSCNVIDAHLDFTPGSNVKQILIQLCKAISEQPSLHTEYLLHHSWLPSDYFAGCLTT